MAAGILLKTSGLSLYGCYDDLKQKEGKFKIKLILKHINIKLYFLI